MRRAADIMISTCMALKKEERCLVITDGQGEIREIAEMLLRAARTICSDAVIHTISPLKQNGQEPDAGTAELMRSFDVVFIVTTKSLSHTKARKAATEAGARIASMCGVTKEMLARAIDIDYEEMKERTGKIADLLDRAETVTVKSNNGTNLSMSISRRDAFGRNSGIYDKKGAWGNLPSGEAFIAPVEGSANGVYVVDASHAGLGMLKSPIDISVKDGLASGFSGGKAAEKLRLMLKSIKDKDAFNIAELGIGTNSKAMITGNILEDEKVLGTCHIALGNNFGFGGAVNTPIHLDGVIRHPSIIIDNKTIIEDSRWLI
ncbi:aminopeptidase [Candidatus Woesearchaeota archaeon]|nr:aminopeptidase [Candidatus Woesearchaeota archaeon]